MTKIKEAFEAGRQYEAILKNIRLIKKLEEYGIGTDKRSRRQELEEQIKKLWEKYGEPKETIKASLDAALWPDKKLDL